jgi:hypothetical protein
VLTLYKHNTNHIKGANAPFFIFILLFVFFLSGFNNCLGQQFNYLTIDTLSPDKATTYLDTVDLLLTDGIRNVPANGYGSGNYHLTFQTLTSNHGLQLASGFTPLERRYTFCAIPYLAVQYGFGSKNTQYAGLRYQQSISPNKHLSLRYKQFKTDGFLRNNQSNAKQVDVRYLHINNSNSTEINATADLDNFGFSGGITDVSLANTYALSSIPVNFENAQSKSNRFQIQFNHHTDLAKDSAVNRGTAFEFGFKTKEVTYNDEGNLAGTYQQINWDSLATRDAFQWNQIDATLSLYEQTKVGYFSAGAFGRYWNYFNRKNELDTVELGIQGKAYINKKVFNWNTDFNYIVTGAQQGYALISRFNFKKKIWIFSSNINYSNQLPDINQRSVWGNNYNSLTSIWSKESRLTITSTIGYDLKNQSLQLTYSQFEGLNNYFFSNGKWRNDTFKHFSVQAIQLQHEFKLGKINLKTNYSYTTDKLKLNIIPVHALRFRIHYHLSSKQAKISKSIGGEFIIFNDFARIGYTPMVNAFDLSNLTNMLPGRSTANFFMAMQLGSLKGFLRYENIGYFWTDKTYIEQSGYPLAGPMLKIGLSWDFYN